MFRKLEEYEPISKTWCECCNGHVVKTFTMICNKPVTSNVVEAVACGGKDCIFEVTIRKYLIKAGNTHSITYSYKPHG